MAGVCNGINGMVDVCNGINKTAGACKWINGMVGLHTQLDAEYMECQMYVME